MPDDAAPGRVLNSGYGDTSLWFSPERPDEVGLSMDVLNLDGAARMTVFLTVADATALRDALTKWITPRSE